MKRNTVLSVAKWTALVLVAFAATIVLFLALFDWNAARAPVAGFIGKRIQREVHIDEIQAKLLSLTPHIAVSGLRIGQPRWATAEQTKEPMADINKITIDFKLLPLFVGDLIITQADIDQPVINLLRAASGEASWQLGAKRFEPSRRPLDLPVIRAFRLHNGSVTINDEVRKLKFSGAIAAGEDMAGTQKLPFRLTGTGTLNTRKFNLRFSGGPLLNVRRDKPYFFDADIRAGATRLSAIGTFPKPFDLGAVQAALTMSGEDLANLYYLTGLALPNTPPYAVEGRMRREGARIIIDDFDGKVGDSDVRGDLTIDVSGERPMLRAEVVSKVLDLDDLAASLGAPPGLQKGETASAAQRQKGEEMAAQRRLFPDARLQLERVRGMDADVKYHARAVNARKIPMREVSFHVKLHAGVLDAEPLSFVLPQGRFSGKVHLDARGATPYTEADLRVTDVQLGQFHRANATAPLEGLLVGRVKLSGRGDSILRFVSSANGSVTAVIPQGEVREAFAELTGINVARGLGLLLTGDQKKVSVRCGVADFKLDAGKLSAQNLVFDTENVLITGKGDLRLDTETADLTIKGQPKKLRFFRVRAPITVQGPLRKPKVGIEGGKTLAQTGAAAALGALLAPLAAVIAFVDTGLAKDANCAQLLAQAEEHGVSKADPKSAKTEAR